MFSFRRRSYLLFLSLTLGSLIVFYFQNCAESFEATLSLPSIQEQDSFVVPVDPEHPPEIPPKEETRYEVLLVDRYYMKSLFEDIFGPSASSVDSSRIFYRSEDQGGPCSIYEDYSSYNSTSGQWAQADALETCGSIVANAIATPVNPKSTVTRQALITHACSDWTTSSATFDYVLHRLSNTTPPQVTKDNILNLFHLFYRGHPDPHQGVLDSFLVMFPDPSHPTLDQWRVAVYAMCVSSYWQIL